MAISTSLYSSRSEEWPTPQQFFISLNREFHFTLDPCAASPRVFCNPPYGRDIQNWARKCFEASRGGALVVLLAHARTDTRWFHDWVYGKADEIRFIRGRLKFGDGRQSAPFPSLVAVYRPASQAER